MKQTNCYKCKYKKEIPGNAHIGCTNKKATVKGNEQGKKNGWFAYPFNFDPVWLENCDGFKKVSKENKG
jgi:hypothetical protein